MGAIFRWRLKSLAQQRCLINTWVRQTMVILKIMLIPAALNWAPTRNQSLC